MALKLNKGFYDARMNEATLLSGYKQTNFKQMAEAIYERICLEYNEKDLDRAINDALGIDGKINYPVLLKYLNRYRSERLEEEAQQKKLKHHKDAERFRALQLEKQNCDHQCKLCEFSRYDKDDRYFCKNIVASLVKKIVYGTREIDGIKAWNELRAEFPDYNICEPTTMTTRHQDSLAVDSVLYSGYWTDIRYLPPAQPSKDNDESID